MMTVTGYADGVAYAVEFDPTASPDPISGRVVTSTPAVASALARVVGETVMLTPVGPAVTVDLSTAEGVLQALGMTTEVVAVVGGPDTPAVAAEPDTHH